MLDRPVGRGTGAACPLCPGDDPMRGDSILKKLLDRPFSIIPPLTLGFVGPTKSIGISGNPQHVF